MSDAGAKHGAAKDAKPEAAKDAAPRDTGAVPGIVGVFLNREVIVDHFKTVAAAINGSEQIKLLMGEGRACVVTKRKTGFTRQLLMGPLDAAPYEYDTKDWEIATQKFDHLPDLMVKRSSSLYIVVGEDSGLLAGVAQTLYRHSQPLSPEDVRHIHDAARHDLKMGDVVIYRRSGFSPDNPGGVFDLVYSLGAPVAQAASAEQSAPAGQAPSAGS